MSDISQGEGWWRASDDKWYPPELHPTALAQSPKSPKSPQGPTTGPAAKKHKRWPWITVGVVVLLIIIANVTPKPSSKSTVVVAKRGVASGLASTSHPKKSASKAATTTAPPTTRVIPTTTTTTVPPTTTTTTAPPPALVITVTGYATATANSITLDINNQETQHTDAALPYTYTDASYVSEGYGVIASAQNASGDPNTTITCTITEGGQQMTTNTATGPYAIAECTG